MTHSDRRVATVSRMTQTRYDEWEAQVHRSERADALWRMEPYRLSRFLMPHAHFDATQLQRQPLGRPLVSQLWRSEVSIPANLAEGFSRGTGADRARFYEYALGSTRECIVWYEGARRMLDDSIIEERLESLVRVKRLVLSILPATRRVDVRNK